LALGLKKSAFWKNYRPILQDMAKAHSLDLQEKVMEYIKEGKGRWKPQKYLV
jgi:hypothetical protein